MAREAFGIATEIADNRLGTEKEPDTGAEVDTTSDSVNGSIKANGEVEDKSVDEKVNGAQDVKVNGLTNGHKDGVVNGNKESISQRYQYRPDSWIPIEEHSLATPTRKVKIISIGCGFSGLTLAHKIQNTMKMDDRIEHVLYEKNEDIGGTWFENRYPGVMCDVPAHIYILLDLPYTEWPTFYATGGEIQKYLTTITNQHNLDRDVQYNSRVTSAIWDGQEGKWHVEVQQGERTIHDTCDILINGSGVLNNWSWPTIKGLHGFKGHLCHSADYKEWNKNTNFDGKRIAVIGNGSSAIQIVPELAKVASHLTNIVRSSTWISAPFAEDLSGAPGTNKQYTEEEKEEFRRNPEKHREHIHELAHAFNHFYEALIEGSEANKEARRRTKEIMEARLKDYPELAEKIIPDWSLGCRRLTPGNGYLEALASPKCDLIRGHIREVTESGIRMEDGTHNEFDVIICATGFDVSFKPRWTMLGKNGKDLSTEWAADAQAYYSLCVSGFPNYFMYNGPGGPVGHGSLSSAIDWEANYILKWVDKVAREGIKSFDVKREVQDEWNVYGDEILKRTVWHSGCKSWYKNDKGRISALYPGSILHFKDIIETVRGEDFDIAYRNPKNRWGFLGNGFTQLEMDGGDLAYYIKTKV